MAESIKESTNTEPFQFIKNYRQQQKLKISKKESPKKKQDPKHNPKTQKKYNPPPQEQGQLQNCPEQVMNLHFYPQYQFPNYSWEDSPIYCGGIPTTPQQNLLRRSSREEDNFKL